MKYTMKASSVLATKLKFMKRLGAFGLYGVFCFFLFSCAHKKSSSLNSPNHSAASSPKSLEIKNASKSEITRSAPFKDLGAVMFAVLKHPPGHPEDNPAYFAPIIYLKGQSPVRAVQFPAEYDNHGWVFSSADLARGRYFGILELQSAGRGWELKVIASFDGGASWAEVGALQKPNFNAVFRDMLMNAQGEGLITLELEHGLKASEKEGLSEIYTFRSRDMGRTWKQEGGYFLDTLDRLSPILFDSRCDQWLVTGDVNKNPCPLFKRGR